MEKFLLCITKLFAMNKKQYLNSDLAAIRSIMERSSKFISLSGLSGIFAGLIALFGGAIAWWYLGKSGFISGNTLYLESSETTHLITQFIFYDGLIILILALISAVFFSWQKSQKKGIPLWDRTTIRVLWNLGLPLIAGGIVIILILIHHQLLLLAPVSLLFYGMALLNAGNFTLSEVRFLGILEIITGLLAAIFPTLGFFCWLFGFGVLHVIYGFIMYRKYESGIKK